MNQISIAGRLDEIVRLLSEIRDGLSTSCPQPCSQLRGCVAQTKEEKEPSPRTPYKEKEETNNNDNSRARMRTRARFMKPTVEEVAAHIREKGYTFSAEAFWNYYESNGWRVGRSAMKSWKSACVTWQRQERSSAQKSAVRRRPDNWIGCSDAERKEFIDGLA